MKHTYLNLRTKSPDETSEIGRSIGALLLPGSIVALVGYLGTGKTVIAKGIASGLEVNNRSEIGSGYEFISASPAFDLIQEFKGKFPVYHMDFYRLENLKPDEYLWLQEYLYGDGVCLIEWGDKFIDALVDTYLRITMNYADKETDRTIKLEVTGNTAIYDPVLEALKSR